LVHLPPHEMGVVEGLDAAEVAQADPRNWRNADAFLVVGNPLTTHPPVAPHFLRWGQGRTNTPVVVIDSVAGVSGNYTPHRLVCRPGYEYWVVAALLASAGLEGKIDQLPKKSFLQQVLKESGIEWERLDRAAKQLRSAHRPAVVVAPASGGADRWRALVALAAGWAKQQNGMVSVLTGSANALAVSRYMRRHGIDLWASGCPEDTDAGTDLLLVVGWDPSSGYPSACWRGVAERAKHVVLASAFPPADADWVDQTVPLAMNSEVGGTYILADGHACRVNRVMSPPSGVPSIRELFAMLGQQLSGRGVDEPIPEPASVSEEDVAATPTTSGAPVPAPPVPDEADGQPAVLMADPVQYMDGQMTRHSWWSQRSGLLPELWIPPRAAAAFGLEDGVTAHIRNNQGAAQVRIVVARDQPDFGGCFSEAAPQGSQAGWWAVSGGFAEIRRMASWRFDVPNESALAGTINVSVEPV